MLDELAIHFGLLRALYLLIKEKNHQFIFSLFFAPIITATAVTLKVDVFSIKILVRRCRNVIMASNCNFWVTDWTGADPDLEPANKGPILVLI